MRTAAWLCLLAYVVLATAPFRWAPPRSVANAAVLGADRVLAFPGPGLARTPGPAWWLAPAIAGDALEVRLRVRSLAAGQTGPARIFTVSADPHNRDLTIGQEGGALAVRVRTPATSFNALPQHFVGGVLAGRGWRDVVLTIRAGALRVTVDGETVLAETLPAGALRVWDDRYRVVLGNEASGDRPWRGEVARAEVEVAGQVVDHLRPGALELPPRYWAGLAVQRAYPLGDPTQRLSVATDVGLNLVGLMPSAFLLAAARPTRRGLALAVAICAAASLGVEVAQVGIETRYASLPDLGLNVLGASLAAVLAYRWRASPRAPRPVPSA